MDAQKQNAARYEWLRSHLQFINFEGLTCDTCDVGLDYAIDKAIRNELVGLRKKQVRH